VGGIQGTGQPGLGTYLLQQQLVSSAGVIYSSNIDGIGTYRVQVVGAGPANVVTASGSLDGTTWTTVYSFTGDKDETVNVQSYHYIKFECTTYDAGPFVLYWKGDAAVPQPSFELLFEDSGLATEANQLIEIAKLNSIDGKLQNPMPVVADAPTTPTVTAVPIVDADTEVSSLLPANTVKFIVKVRGCSSEVRLGFQPTATSGLNYISVPRGSAFREENVRVSTLTLYLSCNRPNQVVEILSWH
jgi:hypothetical protein